MRATDLDDTERLALLTALGHLATADQRLVHDEVAELHALAAEIGERQLLQRIIVARNDAPTEADLARVIAQVKRPEAREWIRTFLFDLSVSDGHRNVPESDVLDLITREWARR